MVTNGGKLCAAHCRHSCCIIALLPGQLSHCSAQMSTSNPLQLHLLHRVSRWNINLLKIRPWKEVKGTGYSTPHPTKLHRGGSFLNQVYFATQYTPQSI